MTRRAARPLGANERNSLCHGFIYPSHANISVLRSVDGTSLCHSSPLRPPLAPLGGVAIARFRALPKGTRNTLEKPNIHVRRV